MERIEMRSMRSSLSPVTVTILLLLPWHGATGQTVVQNASQEIYIPNGIFNPQEIDLDFISSRLVSPQGLVTQFALELETQIIFTSGWLISGGIWQYAMLNTDGELQQTIAPLSFLLSTNSLALTVVRSLFDSMRSLLSRVAITIFVFGWDTTVSNIILLYNVKC